MKMKISPLLNSVLFLLIGLVASSMIKFNTIEFIISTIFNVSGIMFSVGLGLIATFNMNGIRNREIIKSIRNDLNNVRNLFIIYFSISTICLISGKWLIDEKKDIFVIPNTTISLSLSFALTFVMIFCIAYFIYNFFQIQKLSEKIFDELSK